MAGIKSDLLERNVKGYQDRYDHYDHIFACKPIKHFVFDNLKQFHVILDLKHLHLFECKHLNFIQLMIMTNLGNNASNPPHNFLDTDGNIVDIHVYISDKEFNDVTFYDVEYLAESEQRSHMLIIVPSEDVQTLEKKEIYTYLFYNMYVNYHLKYRKRVLWKDIQAQRCPNPIMHWVWFRKPNAKLSAHILKRVQTWLDENPDVTFQLWTNLKDSVELEDFISNLDKEHKALFGTVIHVKFAEEMLRVVPDNLKHIFTSDDPKDMILKTDAFRILVLQKYGGFYSDFNDTLCFVPLRLLFHDSKPDCMFGAENYKQLINNYFMYTPPNHPFFQRCVSQILNHIPNIYNFIHSNHLGKFYLDQTIKFVQALHQRVHPQKISIMDVLSMSMSGFMGELQIFLQTMNFPSKMLRLYINTGHYMHAVLLVAPLEYLGVMIPMVEHGLKEISYARDIRFGQGVSWKSMDMRDKFDTSNIDMDPTIITKLEQLREDEEFHNYFRHRFLMRLPHLFMEYTNIGTIVMREQATNPHLKIYTLPGCEFARIVGVQTAISHFMDSTSCGSTTEYKETIEGVL